MCSIAQLRCEWRGLFAPLEKSCACGMNVLAHAMFNAMMEWNVNGNRTGLGMDSEVMTMVEPKVTIHTDIIWQCLEVGKESSSDVVGRGLETRTCFERRVSEKVECLCERCGSSLSGQLLLPSGVLVLVACVSATVSLCDGCVSNLMSAIVWFAECLRTPIFPGSRIQAHPLRKTCVMWTSMLT